MKITRNQLLNDSQCISRESTNVIKALQEGLGGIRDVLIDGSQAEYYQIYRNADLPLRRAEGRKTFIILSPRFVMEALGMIFIAILAYTLAKQSNGVFQAIPTLGVLALSAQRLLPLFQQVYGALSGIKAGQSSLKDIIELLDQPMPDYSKRKDISILPFKNNIRLDNVCFRYSHETPYVLKAIDLTIARGSRVGFIGATGSGKSTLLDIIMGLLHVTNGTLEVDGRVVTQSNCHLWQRHIAHVPQSIYLADTSVQENIAFGIPKLEIDFERVKQVSIKAQISDMIEAWPNRYETMIGERGVRLSGGQRQRIGIARALYKQADVIIFDEATSALDNETEQVVMQSIDTLSKDLTVLIIAHRISTLKNCSQIVELKDGKIKSIARFEDIKS